MADQKASTRRPDGRPETAADKRFFDLRESGYRGPIDQDGRKVTSGRAADILRSMRAQVALFTGTPRDGSCRQLRPPRGSFPARKAYTS